MTFVNFLYGTTAWKLGLCVSAMVLGATLVALLVADRCWHRDSRRDHNDIAGFLITVVGTILAILVSSLAVTVLSRQDRAQTLVLQEAQVLGAIDHEVGLLPPPFADKVRGHELAYLRAVIEEEWPQMRRAQRPIAARPSLDLLWRDIVAVPAENVGQALTVQGLRQQLDKLAEVRRGRSEIATTGVDRVIWAVVLLGSVTTILFAVLFGVRSFIAHILMTEMLAFVIALAITMIISVDWPYFGEDSVGPDRLIELRSQLT